MDKVKEVKSMLPSVRIIKNELGTVRGVKVDGKTIACSKLEIKAEADGLTRVVIEIPTQDLEFEGMGDMK